MNKENKYTIEIDHQLKIIRYTDSGNILEEEIGAAWDDFLGIPEFTNQKYNLLTD